MNSKRKQIAECRELELSNYLGHIAVHNQHFVVLDNGNSHVLVYEIDSGWCVATVGSHGEDPGQFYSLTGAAFSSKGELYVSDACLGRIQVFDESGAYLRLFSDRIEYPYGLAFTDTDDLVVCDAKNHQVHVFNMYESLVLSLGTFGKDESQFDSPRAVCVARDG
jgi:DNA-binding beta-propeller fold protein YncE